MPQYDREYMMATFGLTMEQTDGHPWATGGDSFLNQEAYSYILRRPAGVTALQAMDNIRGLKSNPIAGIKYAQEEGIKLGLTPAQVYTKGFDRKYLDAIKVRYTMGAAVGALLSSQSLAISKLKPDTFKYIGGFLDGNDSERLAFTCRGARNQAREELSSVDRIIREREGSILRDDTRGHMP